jgi:malate dehydrogenase
MSAVAILGAGPIGRAVTQRLAERGRVRQVIIVDPSADAAAGVALDLRQSAPVAGFETRIAASADVLGAAAASVIVLADRFNQGEWLGQDAAALLEQLTRAGTPAPFVFAGPGQHILMETAFASLGVPRQRLVGTAAAALSGTAASLAGLEVGLAAADVVVTGRPPKFVVAWSAATVAGALVRDRVPAHRLLAIDQALSRLWPPGPYAIASATAPVVEALTLGSRRRHPGLTIVDGELGLRGTAVLLPLELGHGRIRGHAMPSLSAQEQTALINAVGGAAIRPGAPAPGRPSPGSS